MRRSVCELFAGAGGAFLGGHLAGLEAVELVEYDATAAAVLQAATGGALLPAHPSVGRRLPGVVRCMDVRHWRPVPAWGWWASPPCQRHSSAGNGTGPDGFPMLIDALDRAAASRCMPRWVLAENVRGALSDGTVDRVVDQLRERFKRAGYWLVDCADLWLPQRRVRVVLWAGPHELPELPIRLGPPTPAGFAIGLWGTLDGGRNSGANPTQERPRTTDEPAQTVGTRGNLMLVGGGGNPHGKGRAHERNHRDLTRTPSTTICAVPGGGAGNAGPWVVGASRRRLTVAECATLQGFPDGWPWQGTAEQRYRQVGNAVPPVLARAAWEHVIREEVTA